jgi:hypothetical protein
MSSLWKTFDGNVGRKESQHFTKCLRSKFGRHKTRPQKVLLGVWNAGINPFYIFAEKNLFLLSFWNSEVLCFYFLYVFCSKENNRMKANLEYFRIIWKNKSVFQIKVWHFFPGYNLHMYMGLKLLCKYLNTYSSFLLWNKITFPRIQLPTRVYKWDTNLRFELVLNSCSLQT